jgi:hypothetical protein
MKVSEFRKLIREEIRKSIKEGTVKDFFKDSMNAADARGWIKNPKLSDDEKRNKIKSVMKDPTKFNDLMDAFTGELKAIKEDGSESLYYQDAVGNKPAGKLRMQHIDDVEKWKITAMQIGAIVKDRGDDWIAVMPNQDVLGTYSKVLQSGELAIYA